MNRAVIWDVDGTLVSTKDLYLECYRRALEPYVGKLLTDEELLTRGAHSELGMLRMHSGDAYDECIKEFARHYTELHPTHFGGVYDGVEDTLKELRRRGVPNGIVTGKSRNAWEITLIHVELGNFDVIVVDDDVTNPKPDPEGIVRAVEALKVDPSNAIYVGDSPADMEAAIAAGVKPAAAMWSKNDVWREKFMQRVAGLHDIAFLERPPDLLNHIG